MVIIAEYPCESFLQARIEEERIRKERGATLNMIKAHTTPEEYKKNLNNNQKKYINKNKEAYQKYQKEYRESKKINDESQILSKVIKPKDTNISKKMVSMPKEYVRAWREANKEHNAYMARIHANAYHAKNNTKPRRGTLFQLECYRLRNVPMMYA